MPGLEQDEYSRAQSNALYATMNMLELESRKDWR